MLMMPELPSKDASGSCLSMHASRNAGITAILEITRYKPPLTISDRGKYFIILVSLKGFHEDI